jgi:hypothetical protein
MEKVGQGREGDISEGRGPARLAAGSLVAAVVGKRKRKRPRSHRNSLDLFP